MNFASLSTLAATADQENENVDFKREFDLSKKAALWAEIVKDLVAFSNTTGGVILFGIEDDGSDSDADLSSFERLDQSAVMEQFKKYTGHDPEKLTIGTVDRNSRTYPAFFIEKSKYPIVFVKPGTYEVTESKQTTAFPKGGLYFRHGTKSEPANPDDIRQFVDRRIAEVKGSWLDNIRKVVEAPEGSVVVVSAPSPEAHKFQITNDESAPQVRLLPLSENFPYRQQDVIKLVNKKLPKGYSINTHDIQTIKFADNIAPDTKPNMIAKPHSKASPQYSNAFVEHIQHSFQNDNSFFEICREKWRSSLNSPKR